MVVTILAMTSRVCAQTTDAEVLFREGKRLLNAGQIERACGKFEASERLDEENGTELNLADCWERIGRNASAWAMFVKAAGSAKREDRAVEARRRAALLEDKLVHLTIEVSDEVDLDGLTIKRNDQAVDRALWNQPVPVDPDEYAITASAEGRAAWSTTIKVRSKDKVVVVPELARARKRRPDPKKPNPDPPNENATLAIALAVGGGAAIGIATGFAAHSASLQAQSDAVCPTTSCRDAGAVDMNHSARTEAWVANVGWGLGTAAVVGAIVAWTLGNKQHDTAISLAPVITDEHAGLAIGGRF